MRNVNHVDGDVACDFCHRYKEDIRLVKEGGQNTFRFSLAWSRIIPDGTGAVNEPHFYSYCANMLGDYPPNRELDLVSYFQYQYSLMRASAMAVRVYRDMGGDGLIGVVHDGGVLAIFDASFSFLPVYLGYQLAQVMRMQPIMGALLGALLVSPSISGVEGLDFFGIPIPATDYGSTVVPTSRRGRSARA